MRIGPFTRELLEPFHALLNVSAGRPVSLDAERERFDRDVPAHWLAAWDGEGRPVGFVRDHPEPSGRARGEAHAVYGSDRLPVLHQLLVGFLERRPASPLRFVVAAEDPFGDVLVDLGFAGDRHLAHELRLGAIPGSVGVRVADARDADFVHRVLGDAAFAEGGVVLVTVGGVRGALRLELDPDEDLGVVAHLAVEEEGRRQGVAQRLLRAACEHAAARDCRRLTALVPEGSRGARALLEGFGFQRRPEGDQRWLVRG